MHKIAHYMVDLPRPAKRALALAVDASLCVLTVWLAFYLRLDEWVPFFGGVWAPERAALGALLIALPIFVVTGLYRAIFRYAGFQSLLAVARAMAIYSLLYGTLFLVVGVPGVPRTIGVLQPILLFVAVGASRALARYWLGGIYQHILQGLALPRVLIYGAGSAGRQLAAALQNSHEMRVVGFVDDDRRLQGGVVNGLRVYAPVELPTLVGKEQIRDVLLAIPSASRRRRSEIVESLRPLQVAVRSLPGMAELAQGQVHISDLRELDIDDLLGREPATPDRSLLTQFIQGKTVLVTGAGGSIGSELCRQALDLGARQLIMVEWGEFALYSIEEELRAKFGGAEATLVPLLASVQDEMRMRAIVNRFRPDVVLHAAAYKHVPLVEHNVTPGVANNVLGTWIVAQAAREAGVSDFVLISTDKAVRPTNVMGASKRMAEMVLQAMAAGGSGTRFSMVRFGNVLGSSGSVVPRFRQQIRDGGPITLTHPEVTRFFMSIPEAVTLVLQAGAMAEGGEVFVLDMGEPVKIIDLARRMIELSGLSVRDADHPDGDIEIAITGLRPGEKLYEELLIGNDPQPTPHPRILKAREDFLPWSELEVHVATLQRLVLANDVVGIRRLLQSCVVGYQPESAPVDWCYGAAPQACRP